MDNPEWLLYENHFNCLELRFGTLYIDHRVALFGMQRLLQTGVSKFEVALLYIATALFMLPVGVQAASDGISVKLAPYIVGYIGSFPVTATMITVWVSMALLVCLLYTSPSPRDGATSRMPSSA